MPDLPAGAGRRALELDAMDGSEVYKLLSVAVQPRPIAWVATVSADGTRNLAPFSFFTVASRNPATVLVSIGQPPLDPTAPKDTLANIRATGEFVVNIASVELADAVAISSRSVEAHVDEFELGGVAAIPSTVVTPPTVREALIALECRLSGEVPIGTDVVVFGEVCAATALDGVLDDRLHVDVSTHHFLGRLAGPYFTEVASRLPQTAGIGVETPAQQRGAQS